MCRSLNPMRLQARRAAGETSPRFKPASADDELADLREKPGIDRGELVELRVGEADAHRVGQVEEAVGAGRGDELPQSLARLLGGGRRHGLGRLDLGGLHREIAVPLGLRERAVVDPVEQRDEAVLARLERAGGLLQRLAERAPDAHHLADALHLRAEGRVGPGELLEGEAGPLHDDVVDDRLEGRARSA